jgi:adenylate cyclase
MKIDAVHRKHTTVMSADVVGYSAMMSADATATLGALLAHFRRIEAIVRLHGGRIVDAPGDNLLVEFPDEVRALRCAVQVQREIASAPRHAASTPRMHFRIGLHSGDSLERHGRLYGDAVNIAARLQAAAEPDGILMSEAIAERALPGTYRGLSELGPMRFKNVPYAVSTYRPLI